MNDDQFRTEVRRRWGRRREKSGRWVGAFFLVIGVLWLAKVTGALIFPFWFFTWPVFLIALGLFIGLRHGFRGPGWFILMLIGGVFLADHLSDHSYKPYILPVILISIGLFIILRPKRKFRNCGPFYREEPMIITPGSHQTYTQSSDRPAHEQPAVTDDSDVIDITAVFGGIKKKILSKNFKGGDVVAVMGGCEIDLTQADFQQKVMLDTFAMFGGIKLIVPPGWNVQSEVTAIFGGVDDKRPTASTYDPAKVIFLEGTCLFGGIEIKSF